MKRIFLTLLATVVFVLGCSVRDTQAQVYSNKVVGKKQVAERDSIIARGYPYVLPIWGEKAAARGFNLPYSAGLGLNYLWQESDLVIDNFQLGFNNGPLYDLSEVIRFDNATSTAAGLNIRPDIWLFPFLNIYGIVAKSTPSTAVDFGVYVPGDDGVWENVVSLNAKAEFEATTTGFGLTPTVGVGGGWMALDMNFTWSDIAELEDPAFAFVFGPRFGKTVKLRQPERNLTGWVGGFRLNINTGTTGSLPLSDFIPTDGLQAKVDNGITKVSDKQVEVDDWWNSLTDVQQNNPVNIAKYQGATRALDAAGAFLNSLDEALNDGESATIQYSLDKRPKDRWNFIVGGQYQHNKHWMIRAEYGFLGSRKQLIAGLQYRFGL